MSVPETDGYGKDFCLRTDQQWSHISLLLHTISITTRDTEAKGTFGIITIISWTQPSWSVESGSLGPYRWCKCTVNALSHLANNRPLIHLRQQTNNLLLLLSRHTFCLGLSTPNEDKGEQQSLIYQSTLKYLKVPLHRWLDNVSLKTFLSPCWFLLSTSSRRIPGNTQEHWW